MCYLSCMDVFTTKQVVPKVSLQTKQCEAACRGSDHNKYKLSTFSSSLHAVVVFEVSVKAGLKCVCVCGKTCAVLLLTDSRTVITWTWYRTQHLKAPRTNNHQQGSINTRSPPVCHCRPSHLLRKTDWTKQSFMLRLRWAYILHHFDGCLCHMWACQENSLFVSQGVYCTYINAFSKCTAWKENSRGCTHDVIEVKCRQQ